MMQLLMLEVRGMTFLGVFSFFLADKGRRGVDCADCGLCSIDCIRLISGEESCM